MKAAERQRGGPARERARANNTRRGESEGEAMGWGRPLIACTGRENAVVVAAVLLSPTVHLLS
eukprot:143782-Prymnesium_polylepis.1